MRKFQPVHILGVIILLLPFTPSLADVNTPSAESLITSAPRISLEEKDISTFEVRGTMSGDVSLRFIISGQKPDRYSLALLDPHDDTPIAVATQERLTYYNPLTGKVTVVKNMAPTFELSMRDEKGPEPGNTLNFSFGFAPPVEKRPSVVDIRSLLSIGTFEVHANKEMLVLDGKSSRGSRTTAYFRQRGTHSSCERIELTPPDAKDGKPIFVLDSIMVNPTLPPQRFVFPEESLKTSGMPVAEIDNGPETSETDMKNILAALAARAMMYDLVKNSELKLTVAEWNQLKKSDKKIASSLRAIFAEQLTSAKH